MRHTLRFCARAILGIVASAVLGFPAQHAALAQTVDTQGNDWQAIEWSTMSWEDWEAIDWESIDPLVVNCGGNDLCTAFVELAKVMNGQTPNVTWLKDRKSVV